MDRAVYLLVVEMIVSVPDVVDIAVPTKDAEDIEDVVDDELNNAEVDEIVRAVAAGAP